MKHAGIAGLTHEMESLLHSITRYTRFVRSTKLTLAAFAGLLTCVILFYPIFRKDAGGVRIAFTSIEKKGPASQTQMLNAQFHGLDKSNQPFNVVSKIATQIDENTVGLDKVGGDMTLKGGQWLSVSANSGLFRIKENLLDLKGSVEMFNDEGYEFRTERLHINVAEKTAVTHDAVLGHGPLGILKAYGGATVDSARETINFDGPVFVTVYPSQEEKSATGKDTPQ